jgi:prephenate dehydratase
MSDQRLRLAYLGPPGSFGEEAALRYGVTSCLLPFSSHAAVVAAVDAGNADEGVVAIENSIEGAVNETVDLLIHGTNLRIRHELVLPIEQCLLTAPGTKLADIQLIFSHPQALGQCRAYVERHFPEAQIEATLSTAAAVQALATRQASAAIATRRAAEIYGAEVLAAGIQDRLSNATRFVVLGTADAEPSGDDKTSLAVATAHDRPGTLVALLREFADARINLTKIESRPSKDALGIYIFLIDFQGHRLDPKVAGVLERVRARSTFFKILGSYPCDRGDLREEKRLQS